MRQRHFAPLLLSLLLASCGRPAEPTTPPTTTTPPYPTASSLPTPAASLPQTAPTGSTPGTGGDYKLAVTYVPGTDARVRRAVEQGVGLWQRVITKTTGELKVELAAQACGNEAAFSGTVTDLRIYAGNRNIDGPGGILAKSGPCLINTATKLPVVAMLIFDTADLPELEPQLPSVAAHELAHSLGFGSLWSLHGLVRGTDTPDPRYAGTAARREYAALGGILGNVPVENVGGEGTAGTHWREKSFGTELMTGYLNTGFNPLSRMSIASLQDLGYTVDYAAADPFAVGTLNTLNMQANVNYDAQMQRPEWRLVR